MNFMVYLFIPGLIFWSLVPLGFLWHLVRSTKAERESFKMSYRYGYLYSEYKSRFFFWEFIKISIRIIVTISTSMISSDF